MSHLKGKVVHYDRQRLFGFFEPDIKYRMRENIFFHRNAYGQVVEKRGKIGVTSSNYPPLRYPYKGLETIFFVQNGPKGPRAYKWVYSTDYERVRRSANLRREKQEFYENFNRQYGRSNGRSQNNSRTNATTHEHWLDILGFDSIIGLTVSAVNQKFKFLAFRYHPDQVGNAYLEMFQKVSAARDEALEHISRTST